MTQEKSRTPPVSRSARTVVLVRFRLASSMATTTLPQHASHRGEGAWVGITRRAVPCTQREPSGSSCGKARGRAFRHSVSEHSPESSYASKGLKIALVGYRSKVARPSSVAGRKLIERPPRLRSITTSWAQSAAKTSERCATSRTQKGAGLAGN